MAKKKLSAKLPEDTLLTAAELAQIYGIAASTITDKLTRHGFFRDDQKRWRHGDYLKAAAAGAEMDKRNAGKQLAELEGDGKGDTLPAQLLRRKIALLDVDIETAKVKLDELRGRVIDKEVHLERMDSIVRVMLSWWDKASENAATKIKDASILAALREAGDDARRELLEIT